MSAETSVELSIARIDELEEVKYVARLSFNDFDYFWFQQWLPRSKVVVAKYAGKVVGFAQLVKVKTICGPTGVIMYMAVHPDFRGLGIGKKLVLYSEQVFRARGARSCMATTRSYNRVVQKLFESLGYALYDLECLVDRLGERGFDLIRALHAYEDDVLMHKDLEGRCTDLEAAECRLEL